MVNAWSLAASVLNGTLDEDYPIMFTPEDERAVAEAKKKNPDKSDSYFEWDRNGLTENPFKEDIKIDTSTLSSGTVTIPSPESNSAMGPDYINFNVGAGNTGSESDGLNLNLDEDLFASMDGVLGEGAEQLNIQIPDDNSIFDYTSAFDFQMDSKPEPDLSFKSQKYQEDKGIKDLKDYVSSTYRGHYTNKNSDTQTLDLIHSVGDAESFCRSNALKYLSRYDKKGTAKQDILKAMHYCLLLYYFSGNTKEPDYTNTRYETF